MAKSGDLFGNGPGGNDGYSGKDIEVLEGLEPVRRRPGMYVGGTDERALHHLASEILDNAMDEAVAGFADHIDLELRADGTLLIRDNGRGIPIDPHPKLKPKTALEVVFTVLHAGGKFSGDAYQTSGGLHGVGASVVNALSEWLEVEVAKDRQLYFMRFERGVPKTKLKAMGPTQNRRGSTITFLPDHQIFGKELRFKPARLYKLARSKAYLFRGVEIRWSCDPSLLKEGEDTPSEAVLHFPGGLADFLSATLEKETTVTPRPFAGRFEPKDKRGAVEWAVHWAPGRDSFLNSYANTIPTPQGGTHDAGLRAALTKGLRGYAELSNNKRAGNVTSDDVMASVCGMLSVFVRDPEFQGQTKDRLSNPEAQRFVESAVRDHFDHWLAESPADADRLLQHAIEMADERMRRRAEKEVSRKSATRKLRLPGKLADCSSGANEGTELFLVEGDSAGGSAKQARDRNTQAVLPLRGKILNVASAAAGKLQQNQELSDLLQAIGAATGAKYRGEDVRYDRIIVMTDADVDGAHIASLLITFFYREMPGLIRDGRLYLAMPPLYRLTQGSKSMYARDEKHRDELIKTAFRANAKVDVGRFKGLGEMMPAQLKETTMQPGKRTLLKVTIPDGEEASTGDLVERLMGRKPELRFQYIQEHARFVEELDV
jgi:topoisomerase-4 subunit B